MPLTSTLMQVILKLTQEIFTDASHVLVYASHGQVDAIVVTCLVDFDAGYVDADVVALSQAESSVVQASQVDSNVVETSKTEPK